jgi:hypothetical protein
MAMTDESAGESNKGQGTRAPSGKLDRKPYSKPAFRFERVFETMALSCGKVTSTQFQCRFNRKNS